MYFLVHTYIYSLYTLQQTHMNLIKKPVNNDITLYDAISYFYYEKLFVINSATAYYLRNNINKIEVSTEINKLIKYVDRNIN